ncbi:uncharacterized protein LOC144487446 isoform X2 [Mustelus asterias]
MKRRPGAGKGFRSYEMSSTKRKRKLGSPKVEECGIWLDTRKLKRSKMEPPSISRLLGPLSRRNYNIDVAVNFTQTRAPQRCVRQTTVSSFFLPTSTGKLTKPSRTSSLGAASADSGRSVIGRELCDSQTQLAIETDFRSDALGSNTLVNQQERSPASLECGSSEERELLCGAARGNTTRTLNGQSSQVIEQRQHLYLRGGASANIVARELVSARGSADESTASAGVPNVPPDNLTQPDFSQDSQGNRVISHRKATGSPPPAADEGAPAAGGDSDSWLPAGSVALCTQGFEAGLCAPLASTPRTANQERGLWKSQVPAAAPSPRKLNSVRGRGSSAGNKENVFACPAHLSPASSKGPPGSQGTTPLLCRQNSPHAAGAPAFKRPCGDRNTLSLLFSQDSQGNRVISHRHPDSRRGVALPDSWNLPLPCCPNIPNGDKGCGVPPNVKLSHSDLAGSEHEDTPCPRADSLFTQDSEGYVVIKHH